MPTMHLIRIDLLGRVLRQCAGDTHAATIWYNCPSCEEARAVQVTQWISNAAINVDNSDIRNAILAERPTEQFCDCLRRRCRIGAMYQRQYRGTFEKKGRQD